MASLPQQVSESTKRRNPHLYGLAGLQVPIAQQASRDVVKRKDAGKANRQGSIRSGSQPVLRITLVSFRKTQRRLDSDNLSGGFKHLRDAIAESLGYDDTDNLIQWEYGQVETRGPAGTMIRIQII